MIRRRSVPGTGPNTVLNIELRMSLLLIFVEKFKIDAVAVFVIHKLFGLYVFRNLSRNF